EAERAEQDAGRAVLVHLVLHPETIRPGALAALHAREERPGSREDAVNPDIQELPGVPDRPIAEGHEALEVHGEEVALVATRARGARAVARQAGERELRDGRRGRAAAQGVALVETQRHRASWSGE